MAILCSWVEWGTVGSGRNLFLCQKWKDPGPRTSRGCEEEVGAQPSFLSALPLEAQGFPLSAALQVFTSCPIAVSGVLSLCSPCFLGRAVASFPCFQLLFSSVSPFFSGISLPTLFLFWSPLFLSLCSIPPIPSIFSTFSKLQTLFPISPTGLLPL